MWFEKMIHVISKGLSDMEELERMKAEKRIQAIAETTATNIGLIEPSSTVDWSFPSDFALDPGLLADLGILGSVETLRDTQSGS